MVVVGLLGGLLFGISQVRRWDDWDKCRTWTVGPRENEPEYRKRAVELCVAGRREYRSGLFGLGSELRSRAAGRCGQLWAAVEVPPKGAEVLNPFALQAYGLEWPFADTPADQHRFMNACVPARTAELEARRANGGD